MKWLVERAFEEFSFVLGVEITSGGETQEGHRNVLQCKLNKIQ